MPHRLGPTFALPILLLASIALRAQPSAAPHPPPTRQENFKEVLHGVEIPDPYRWLEDQQSPETRRWIDAQNRYTHALLDPLPYHDAIRRRLGELVEVDRTELPIE